MSKEYLIKNSNNLIVLNALEDGAAAQLTPTDVSVAFFPPFGDTKVLELTRSAPIGTGFSYSGGTLEINPGELTEGLTELIDERLYRAELIIKTASQPDGIVFGGPDSANKMFVHVSSAP